ncbi:Kynurenine/alpha-aminoadipate aminotransferase, mitochondrial [Manis javanica]|nr:Kynurenine/alpha-aminoadipate aminotransferase, mitochondrial [Manis javanica]
MWGQLFAAAPALLSLQGQIRGCWSMPSSRASSHPANPFPSSRELARHLGVARITVVLAYQQLAEEAFLLSRQRKGHFIHPTYSKGARQAALRPAAPWRRPPHRLVAALWLLPSQQRSIVKEEDWQRYLSLPVRPVRQEPVSHGRLARMLPQGPGRAGHTPVGARPDRARRRDADPSRCRPRSCAPPHPGPRPTESSHHRGCAARLLHSGRPADARGHGRGHRGPGYPDARNIFSRPPRSSRCRWTARVTAGHAAAAPARLPLRDAQPPMPTGVTMPLARREALLEMAEAHDIILIEDDYESRKQLRRPAHSGAQEPGPQQPRDLRGQPVQSLAPGLPVGYIVAAPELIRELRALRPAHDPPPRHLRAAHAWPCSSPWAITRPSSGAWLGAGRSGTRR